MTDLHQNCIILSVDKASDNVAIIFKRFYAITLLKELGITIGNSNTNETYEMINTTSEHDIIDKHTRFLSRFKLSINEENKYLPHIYWLLKLPKNPTRFLIAAPNYSLKPVSIYITTVFKACVRFFSFSHQMIPLK